MFADVFAEHGLAPGRVAADTLAYFRSRQHVTGVIMDDPEVFILDIWDNVQALKAVTLWRGEVAQEYRGLATELADGMLGWLKLRETPTGMLPWGASQADPAGYCAETTSEYVASLMRLGYRKEARLRAAFLRSRQRPSGEWELEYVHMPAEVRTQPSVTGFALEALLVAEVPPFDIESALAYLSKQQRADGDFGTSRWYYDTPYYFLRPATAILARYGYHAAVANARDFVIDRQRADGCWPRNAEDGSSDEFHTALALETLAHTGLSTEHPAVRRGVDWLLSRRKPDGSWNGGWYPDYPEVTLSLIRASADARAFGRVPQNVYATAQILSTFYHLANVEAHHGAISR